MLQLFKFWKGRTFFETTTWMLLGSSESLAIIKGESWLSHMLLCSLRDGIGWVMWLTELRPGVILQLLQCINLVSAVLISALIMPMDKFT